MTVSFPRTDRTRSSKHLDESFDDSTVVDRVFERARSIRAVAHSPRPPRDTVFGIPTTPILAWADLGFVDPRRTKTRVYAYTCIERAKQDIGLHSDTIPDFPLCLLLVRRTMVVWPGWRTRMVEVYRYRDRMKHRVGSGVRHEVQMRP